MKTAWRFFWAAVLLGCVPAFASDASALRDWKNRSSAAATEWFRKQDNRIRTAQAALSTFYQVESEVLSKITDGGLLPKFQKFLDDEYYLRQAALIQAGKLMTKEFNRRMAKIEQVVKETLADRKASNLGSKLTGIDYLEKNSQGDGDDSLEELRAKEEARQRGNFVSFDALTEPTIEKIPRLTVWKNKQVFFQYVLADRDIAPTDREWGSMQNAVGRLLNGVPDDNLTFENPTAEGDQGLRYKGQKFKIKFMGVTYSQPQAYPGGYPPAPVPSYYILEDSKDIELRLISLSKFTLRRQRLMKLLEGK